MTTRLEVAQQTLEQLREGLATQGLATDAATILQLDQNQALLELTKAIEELLGGDDVALLRDHIRRIALAVGTAVPVSITTLPIASGAALDLTLTAVLTALSLQARLTDTQPVSMAGLPLPAGASTEATLALIKAKTDNLDVALSTRTKPGDVQHVDDNGGSLTVDGSVSVGNFPAMQPVSGTVAVSNLPATQPVSAASLPLPTGAASESTVAAIKTNTDKIPSQGQALAAASLPVVLTAAQVATLTPPAAIAGFALEAGHLAAIDAAIAAQARLVDTQPVSVVALPLPAGAAADASLTSLRAQLPSTLGQTLGLTALPVVLASDQDSIGDRYRRRIEEDGLVETMDLGSLALATRGARERYSPADRRGRISRGTNR